MCYAAQECPESHAQILSGFSTSNGCCYEILVLVTHKKTAAMHAAVFYLQVSLFFIGIYYITPGLYFKRRAAKHFFGAHKHIVGFAMQCGIAYGNGLLFGRKV